MLNKIPLFNIEIGGITGYI